MQFNRNLVQIIYNRQIGDVSLTTVTANFVLRLCHEKTDKKIAKCRVSSLTSLYRHFSVTYKNGCPGPRQMLTYSLCSSRVRLYFIGKTSIKFFSKMDNRYMYIISPNSDKTDPYMTEKQVILHFSTKTNISKFQFDQDRGPAGQIATYEHSRILSVFAG